ncbi:Na+/H+ antiporter family protein [Halalkalibacterium halodurans]|uniref:BH1986 protein n=2 Tax=Halalkalibacterium halodurans TaxID=86665 RepID=Q9KBE2_HALH5|nr:Na+/H+ antiporter family protein [Halalkalibacterium halodurans]MED4082610.1 Na+/H+ antiporter family protein [Halalkalibacterium halodurans]MED4085936.1 Na+/H+ antiporter family protein [Halalkalibacterium halodurans]MED4104030.1 Na+/H+ antiporter family protein [Halalkalibacterium halodurans]MED4109819.1 Na+/H+ antiporter family protein [Halalkalibacterium halodurans]MED4123979.1 Na+/H+ antiporter family protein [Halalkalibacterium halodurans]
MFNAVVISVVVMIVLSLLRVNVILAIILAAITAGLVASLSITDTMQLLLSGMGGQANTALSYILLGGFAVMIGYSGITSFLVKRLISVLKGRRAFMLLAIAGIASLSQNVIPVHIAFIPILIPPLLLLFDKMKVDRRGVAASLTFGLKAPYILIPAGYGLLFHSIIADEMTANGMSISIEQIPLAMLFPGLAMVVGLLVAIFITYGKDREPRNDAQVDEQSTINETAATEEREFFSLKHVLTLLAIVAALTVQILFQSLVLGALTGIILMFAFRVVPFHRGDEVMNEGVKMMGTIAFVMLIASGYATVLKETGAVEQLVASTSSSLGSHSFLIALVLIFIGLVITMGIGSSFGTIPIIAALYVPLCAAVGFSPLATAALIGTAGVLGDAGSPASDSTLGPTSGLNADGKHHHIWDTCVPTFLHYNIPLIVFGLIAAMVL